MIDALSSNICNGESSFGRTCNLFCLPENVFSIIFPLLLTLQDVCQMDTALCNKSLRSRFHHYLKSHTWIDSPTVQMSRAAFFIWLASRGEIYWTSSIPSSQSKIIYRICRVSTIYWCIYHLSVFKLLSISFVFNVLGVSTRHLRGRQFENNGNLTPDVLNDSILLDIVDRCSRLSMCNLKLNPSSLPIWRLALTSVNFDGCAFISDKSFMKFVERLYNVRCFSMSGISVNISDDSIGQLALHCPLLEKMNLSGFSGLSDRSMILLAQSCPQLQILDLSCNFSLGAQGSDVTDGAIIAIARSCHQLQELSLRGRKRITDVAMDALSSHCRNLTVIDFGGCRGISGNGVVTLATANNRLSHINISGCTDVVDASIVAIMGCCRLLKTLAVAHCTLLSNISIIAIADHGCNLESLNLARLSPRMGENVAVISALALLRLVTSCKQLKQLDYSGCVGSYGIRDQIHAINPALRLDFEEI